MLSAVTIARKSPGVPLSRSDAGLSCSDAGLSCSDAFLLLLGCRLFLLGRLFLFRKTTGMERKLANKTHDSGRKSAVATFQRSSGQKLRKSVFSRRLSHGFDIPQRLYLDFLEPAFSETTISFRERPKNHRFPQFLSTTPLISGIDDPERRETTLGAKHRGALASTQRTKSANGERCTVHGRAAKAQTVPRSPCPRNGQGGRALLSRCAKSERPLTRMCSLERPDCTHQSRARGAAPSSSAS